MDHVLTNIDEVVFPSQMLIDDRLSPLDFVVYSIVFEDGHSGIISTKNAFDVVREYGPGITLDDAINSLDTLRRTGWLAVNGETLISTEPENFSDLKRLFDAVLPRFAPGFGPRRTP